jgi:serine/threonine protein kinase
MRTYNTFLTEGDCICNGKYTVVSRFPAAWCGGVYKVYDASLKRYLFAKRVVKIEDDEISNFEQEMLVSGAQIMGGLHHPNILCMHYIEQDEDATYLLLDFVEGYTIDEFMHTTERIPPKKATQYILQLCDIMEYLHTETDSKPAIVYRELAPQNIILGKNGEFYFGDFSYSVPLDDKHNAILTKTVGTPGYTAPELYKKGQAVEISSDIFSLGAMYYYMLTGDMPSKYVKSDGSMQPSYLYRPSRFYVDIPSPLDDIVIKAMSPKPEDRYQTVGEFRKAILKATCDYFIQDSKKGIRFRNRLLIGRKVCNNRYTCWKTILAGHSHAYEMWDTKTEQCVFVKEADKNALAQEKRVLSVLHHNCLPHMIDYFQENDADYLVLNYVAGESLFDYVITKGVLELHDFYDIMLQVCDIVDYLHNTTSKQYKVISNSIKPRDIIVGYNNSITLVDFDVADLVRYDGKECNTRAKYAGTPGFAAPEVYYTDSPLDTRSDIFSIGAVMYYALTSDNISRYVNMRGIMVDRPHTKELNSQVSEELDAIIEKALSNKPEDRFQSAKELKEALLAAM